MSKKRDQEEQVVHEHDAFIKMMLGLKDSAVAKQKVLTISVIVVVLGLIAAAVIFAVDERRTDAQLNAVDGALTIEEMETAAQKHPDDVGLLLRLGQAYALRNDAGDIAKAQDRIGKAAAAAKTDLEKAVASLALGKIKMDLKKYEEALLLFDGAAAALDVQSLMQDEAQWHAGRCLEHLNQPEKAGERYDKVGLYTAQRSSSPWTALADFRKAELRRESLE